MFRLVMGSKYSVYIWKMKLPKNEWYFVCWLCKCFLPFFLFGYLLFSEVIYGKQRPNSKSKRRKDDDREIEKWMMNSAQVNEKETNDPVQFPEWVCVYKVISGKNLR